MQKSVINEFLLLRRPAGEPQAFTTDIDLILKNEDLLTAIKLAAPQFYASLIQQRAPDAKARLTLLKYFNRYCFRPTPFGLFSVITPTTWDSVDPLPDHTGIPDQDLFYAQADNHFAYQLGEQLQDPGTDLLEPNPTLYRVQQEYRFIRTDKDRGTGKRQYLLQATDHTVILKKLLAKCEGGRSPQHISDLIRQASHCDAEEAQEYLEFLKDAQVLITVLRQNITGTDHLQLLAAGNPDRTPPELNELLTQFGQAIHYEPDHVNNLLDQVNAIDTGQTDQVRSRLSVIRLRPQAERTLTAAERETLSQALYALECLRPTSAKNPMQGFIDQFNRHFEGQTLPLLTVLDPETGIGYQAPETEKGNELLETLQIAESRTKQEQLHWSAVHQLLLNAWHAPQREPFAPIELRTDALAALPSITTNARQSGYGLFFRTNGQEVWIESAGGYHTNNLPGRFTPASEMILAATKAMAAHEQALNPDILFAELLHLADLGTDNVNRRAAMLDREIPLTAASTRPKKDQLALADLQVSIVQGKVVLISKKQGKVVMPRLSSAYNHTINSLPLFRFLADIPYQYNSPVNSLDLPQMFPGLHYYPRVRYRQAILSPAQWFLKSAEIESLTGHDETTLLRNFSELRERIGLPQLFAWTQGDQQLYFNAHNNAEILFFAACIKQAKQVKLQEVLAEQNQPEGASLPVTAQYNAFVMATRPLAVSYPAKTISKVTKNKRLFMPGSEWLYLKIYTTRLGTNDLLKQLAPYLKKQQRNGTVRQWFFVRYEDHAPHIRLRLLVPPTALGTVLTDMRQLFESRVERHVIREYQVDTYSRELERYGIGVFEEVEKFFWHSSELVLKFLSSRQTNASTNPPYAFALAITQALIKAAFPEKEAASVYAYRRYQQFSGEFAGDKIHVELDQKFRALRQRISETLADEQYFKRHHLKEQNDRCVAQFQALTGQARTGTAEYEHLVSSLIHMHLNRLFSSESRKQEMIVFYLFYKYAKGVTSRAIH